MRLASRLLAVAALGSLLSASPPASANMAAVRRNPGIFAGPRAARRTPLVVESERLILDCEEDDVPVCRFRVTYQIHNPTGAREEVLAAFYGLDTRAVEVRVDGEETRRELTEEETAELDRIVEELGWDPSFPRQVADEPRIRRTGLGLVVGAGRTREVVTTGVVDLGEFFVPTGYAYPAHRARHVVLHMGEEDGTYDLDYLISPIRTWGGVGSIEIVVRYPPSWGFRGSFVGHGGEDGPRRHLEGSWSTSQLEERTLSSLRIDAADWAVLTMSFDVPGPVLHLGGVLVGFGGRLGGGPRLRAGYEGDVDGSVLVSLSADTDFDDHLVLAPLAEVATDVVLVVPSLGVGIGVPVQLRPDVQVGVRLQLDVVFAVLGFVTSFDFYPGAEDGDVVQVTMLGQLSI